MRAITISAQANGYTAVEAPSIGNPLGDYGRERGVRVFETFDGLVEWLKQNLDKPEEQPTRSKSFTDQVRDLMNISVEPQPFCPECTSAVGYPSLCRLPGRAAATR